MTNSDLIIAEHIEKKYAGRTILHDISLTVEAGMGIAFVGENGCGKSTLLRIMAGLTEPAGGTCRYREAIRMAFIPDHFDGLSFTLSQFITEMMKTEGIDDSAHRKKIQEYYHEFALEDMLATKMKNLSRGTLQKAAVLQAMVGEYDVIFMDEPLSGQDTHSQKFFAEQMEQKRQQGTALVMACHEKLLVEQCAQRVWRISHGQLVDGTEYISL